MDSAHAAEHSPVAGRRAGDAHDAEVPLLPAEPSTGRVLVLAAGRQPAVLHPVDVQRQAERVVTVTPRGER